MVPRDTTASSPPRSTVLAPWGRGFPKISEVLPLRYPHGLPPVTVTRLTEQWSDDHTAFRRCGSARRPPCVLAGARFGILAGHPEQAA